MNRDEVRADAESTPRPPRDRSITCRSLHEQIEDVWQHVRGEAGAVVATSTLPHWSTCAERASSGRRHVDLERVPRPLPLGMAILVGASFVVNLRVLQVSGLIPLHRLQPLYRFVWIGFTINLASGLVLFVTEAADRVVDPVFYIKLTSIAAALTLGAAVKRLAIHPTEAPLVASVQARSLAAASLGMWTVAIVAGRLMAYLKH